MKIVGIYKITSPTNKIYIGQSIDIIYRFNRYYKLNCKRQPYIYNSLKKYGVENHKFEIICQCNISELNNLEVYYIELYQSFNSKNGLNLQSGGNSKLQSSATKEKISNSNKGRKLTEEQRNKLSLIAKKRKVSDVTKLKMSNTRKKLPSFNIGRKASEETRIKMSISRKGKISPLKGRKLTSEHKYKISLSSGKGMRNKKHSIETKNKISNSQKKRLNKTIIND